MTPLKARGCTSLLAALVSLTSVTVGQASASRVERPPVTNRCPVGAVPLTPADLPALRRFGLAIAPHGVQRGKGLPRPVDYCDARAQAKIGTFYARYVRLACPRRVADKLVARTADVAVGYPRVNWSASASYSLFLVARTPGGFVAWAQMH